MTTEQSEKVLKYVEANGPVSTLKLAELWQEEHQKVVGIVNSLLSLGEVIETEKESSAHWVLTDEGKATVESGSHEALVYNAIPDGGTTQAEIMAKVPLAKIGFSKAMSLGWIAIDKSGGGPPKVVRKVQTIEDLVQKNLKDIDSISNQIKQDYKKRKLISEVMVKSYLIKPGPSFTTSVDKQETDLTPEMIASGSWKTKQFKSYNLDALGTTIARGHLHPLMKVRAEFRQIFLEMGFTEMPTNNFVESSFWNFDALFQPQQHPARDAHDTFFLSDPSTTTDIPSDYMERVKKVHSVGGFGSVGYGYDWKIEEARKNLLRTHTTAVSARMLYKLAQDGFKPVKYFSIDRVFRNETLDATHLAEFHQIEGVVADYGLTLGDLIGILYEFFRKLGIEQLRFKPAYNPYTEPSMEIFSYHPGLGKWVEIGNSGIFRPEMLLPMGLPEDVTVIAWGLSLERPTMIKYGVDNIRDLVGPKVNLQMIADNPICRLDKYRGTEKKELDLDELEQRIDSITTRLENMQREMVNLRNTSSFKPEKLSIVIEADPSFPPESVKTMLKFLSTLPITATITTHRHSTLTQDLTQDISNWLLPRSSGQNRIDNQLNVTWIWKPIGQSPTAKEVNTSNSKELHGEHTITRLLARFIESWTDVTMYEHFDLVTCAQIDEWLDSFEDQSVMKRLESRLNHSEWLVGKGAGTKTLADYVLASAVQHRQASGRVKEWILRCTKF